ncbi:MAG: hypothetical protein COB99_04775 [Sulfurimonas sp.]|nr:MAG: hypothetical protein COB99_04775 [Sulfurimonas sp.]
MKKYIILVFLLFFSLSLQANTPKIDECVNDIYFANSIMTSEEDSKIKLGFIEDNILLEQYNGDEAKMSRELNFKTSYNQTHGYVGDIFDTYMFLSLEEDGWDTYTTIMKLVLTRGLSKATDIAGKLSKLSKKEKELFDKIVSDSGGTNYLDIYSVDRNIDLSKQINDYRKSIRLGHGIIIVAHGKGDIFTAKAYEDMLKPEGDRDNAWLEEYVSWMSVGSPTREPRGFHPYINFDNDKVAYQGTLDATTNPNRSYTLNAVNEYIENSSDMQFHKFDYYMGKNISFEDGYGRRDISTDIGKKVIMDFLSSSIEKHRNASSQWAIDQEIEKGTKNYRITVKNIRDSSIVMSEEVYPFAASKKLYYVQGTVSEDISGYVKASCGGTKILDADIDTWANKQANEVYYLDGTGEKIISEDFDCATETCLCGTEGQVWNPTTEQCEVLEKVYSVYVGYWAVNFQSNPDPATNGSIALIYLNYQGGWNNSNKLYRNENITDSQVIKGTYTGNYMGAGHKSDYYTDSTSWASMRALFIFSVGSLMPNGGFNDPSSDWSVYCYSPVTAEQYVDQVIIELKALMLAQGLWFPEG